MRDRPELYHKIKKAAEDLGRMTLMVYGASYSSEKEPFYNKET